MIDITGYRFARRAMTCLFLVISMWEMALSQTDTPPPPPAPRIYFSNREVYASNLPSLTAPSKEASAVVVTAVETILDDKNLCCGKDSTLESIVLSATPSLKELGARLPGKHVTGDGLSVTIDAEYVPQSAVGSAVVISTLHDHQPMLMEWKSHVYVLYGANYDEVQDENGAHEFLIHKLYLLDMRFSDQRRQVVFNRESDDWNQIRGLLRLSVVRP